MKHNFKEKLKVVIKTVLITITFILISGKLFSQKLVFKLIPSYSLSFGTYRTKVDEQVGLINMNSVYPKNNIKFSHGSFGVDLIFYEMKKVSFGFSCFRGGAKTNLNYVYVSNQENINSDLSSGISEISEKQGGGTSIRELGLFMTATIRKNNFTSNLNINHNISVYAFFLKDKTNFQPLFDNEVYLLDGVLVSNYENYKNVFQEKKGLACMIRYDFSIHKNSKNLINFFISYQQGMQIMDKITLEVNHSNGSLLKCTSVSYGSMLSFGIAKSITILPLKKRCVK